MIVVSGRRAGAIQWAFACLKCRRGERTTTARQGPEQRAGKLEAQRAGAGVKHTSLENENFAKLDSEVAIRVVVSVVFWL